MVDEESTKLRKNVNSNTHYITLSAQFISDSTFPFRSGEKIKVRIVKTEAYFESKNPRNNYLIIEKVEK